jgi:hypothetical protein
MAHLSLDTEVSNCLMPDLQKRRILVVDDEECIRAVFAMVLQREGEDVERLGHPSWKS